MTKGNGKNGANGHKRDPFGSARRQREYRQREKAKKQRTNANSLKHFPDLHADGSCTLKFSDGDEINFSAQQWTWLCKLLSVGCCPLITQTEIPGKKSLVTVTAATGLPSGKRDDRWLKLCANDPNRDAVQVLREDK